MPNDELTTIQERNGAARQMVSDLCHQRREWILSIPPVPALCDALEAAWQERDELRARVVELEDTLEQIAQWAEAYPVTVFIPLTSGEMQWADSVLREAGISMGAMHASWARHIVDGIGGIARTGIEHSATAPREDREA